MTEAKIKWKTEIFAPYPYAIELVAGECYWYYDKSSDDGIGFYAHASAGWSNGGISINGGMPAGRVPIPTGVNLTWLSHAERKFYHVDYQLPKKKIAEAFQECFDNEFSKERNINQYKNINFAFAPGGFVSIRLAGSTVKEIDHLQATEAEMPWTFFALTNHFNPEVLTEEKYNAGFIQQMPEPFRTEAINGIFPLDRWKKYSEKKFKWHVATTMDLVGFRQFSVNGEMFFTTKSDYEKNEKGVMNPVPTWFKWFYKEHGKKYQATICFSKTSPDAKENPLSNIEVFETFEKFFASSSNQAALVIDKFEGEFLAYLTNGSKKVDLNVYHSMNRELEPNEFGWFI